jgi:alginate O-acetyltransferase complex protein AlgI
MLQTPLGTTLRVTMTFACVMIGWVFFYAASLEAEDILKQSTADARDGARVHAVKYSAYGASTTILHRLFVNHQGMGPPLHTRGLWYTVAVVALCHVLGQSGWWKRMAVRLPAPVMGFGYAAVLTLALVLTPDQGRSFIYFQF